MSELETLACVTRVVLFSDERAFEQIVRAYQEPLRLFLLQQTDGDSELCDDLAQETFIKAWQQMSTFRRASAFKTWLFSIAYHLYMDECRRRRSHPEVDVALLPSEDESYIAREERARWVENAVEQLPEPARTCINLFYLQGMTSKEVSRITGLSEANVRQIIFRSKDKLKTILNENRID